MGAQSFILIIFNQERTNTRTFRVIAVTSDRAKIQPFDAGKNAKRTVQALSFDRMPVYPAIISITAECVCDLEFECFNHDITLQYGKQ